VEYWQANGPDWELVDLSQSVTPTQRETTEYNVTYMRLMQSPTRIAMITMAATTAALTAMPITTHTHTHTHMTY